MDFKLIDSHVHFDVKGYEIIGIENKYIEEYGIEKWNKLQSKNQYQKESWAKAWGFPKREPTDDDVKQTSIRWLNEMERYNIDKLVFVTGGGNELLSRIVQEHPQHFIGYAHHNPFETNAAQKLETAVAHQGLKGYKIIAPDLSGRMDDSALNPVWKVAENNQIPVLIHFGILGAAGGLAKHDNINPMIMHDVARAYPDIPFIIPHFGCGHPQELLQLAWVCPNIYVDTSGSNQWIRWMPYPLTLKDLFKKYYETIGPERIIFGTDSEWFPRGFVKQYYDEQRKDCIELGMKQEEIKMIFRNNIARLLKQEEH
ncbi:MAG: amidohydrolase family protein [Ruminiclostridium sp.]